MPDTITFDEAQSQPDTFSFEDVASEQEEERGQGLDPSTLKISGKVFNAPQADTSGNVVGVAPMLSPESLGQAKVVAPDERMMVQPPSFATGQSGLMTPLVAPELYRDPKDLEESLHNVVLKTAAGATAPLTILGGAGMMAKPLQAPLLAGFTGFGAKQSLEGIRELFKEDMTVPQVAEKVGDIGVGLAMTALPAMGLANKLLPRSTAAARTTGGLPDASKIGETETVHGDVRSQPIEIVREVPAQERGEGVQPQAAKIQTEQTRVLLTPAETEALAKSNRGEDLTKAEEGLAEQAKSKQPPEPVEQSPPDMLNRDPRLAGPGSPAASELSQDPGNPDIYGVAERVRAERAKAGQVAEVSPGEGVSAPDAVEHGRQILAKDPLAGEKAMSAFEADPKKAVSFDAMAVARAHGEQLAKEASATEIKHGTDSDEYRAAWKKLSDWDTRSKSMQTEWHKTGQAQQGETDIDTGSFTGLQREYKQQTGEELPPQKVPKAKKTAKEVKQARDAVEQSKQTLFDKIKEKGASEGTKKPSGARKELPAYVWTKAREYIESGMDNFDDIRHKIATDLGLPVKQVTEAMAENKKGKVLTDDLWKKQQTLRRLHQAAKRWLKESQLPMYRRALENVPKILFSAKVGFHGTVALGTHAPMVAFQPRFWATYVKNFGKMYKMVGSPAYYESQVQDLLRRPNYITARRAGLVNDPYQYEDYNSPDIMKYFGRLTGMGNRGYSVLKLLRQDMFDQHWNQLPKTARIGQIAEAIADGVNHATGVVKVSAPKGTSVALFAPRLEMSRVAWLVADPMKSAATFLNWKNATEGNKMFAVNQVKEKAWVAGTMLGLLAINQGMLSATDSKQKINFTDPFHSDFLKFKAAGMSMAYGNAMISMARLPVRLYKIRQSDGGKLKNVIYPDENTYSVLGEYARSQLSPFASLATSLWLKGDWQNRPLPNSTRPVPKRLRAQGVKPYTWPEFWTEQVLPIPAEEAMREVWGMAFGADRYEQDKLLKAVATISIMSATGARLTDDIPYKK